MKNKIELVCMLAAAAMVSCSKQEITAPAVKDGYVRIELKASGESGDFMRTGIAEGQGSTRTVSWNKGDKILVWYGKGTVSGEAVESGKTATFSLEVPEASEELLGVYPYDTQAEFSTGSVSVVFPEEQSGLFAKSNISVTKTSTKSKTCQFYNAGAYLKFVVTDPDITKITVETVGGEPLVGKLPLTFKSDASVVTGTPSNTSSKASVLVDGAGDYYLSVLPGITYASGLTVRFYIDGEEKYGVSRGKYTTTDASICVNRSQIASFGALDKRVGNIYVTVNGAGSGDGSSWDNAMSGAALATMLTVNTSGKEVTEKCAAIDGVTFRLGSGYYDLGNKPVVDFTMNGEQCNIRFVGGYAAGGSDLPDTTSNHSVITGGSIHPAMVLKKNVNAIFSLVEISGGLSMKSNDAALQVLEGASARLEGCRIHDNSVNDGVDSPASAVYVDTESSLTAVRTIFSGNSGYSGSALALYGNTTLKECLIQDNKASSAAAGVLADPPIPVKISLQDCIFSSNSVTEVEGTKGGALCLAGEGDIELIGCRFEANSAYQGGAIALAGTGSINLDGCIFNGNHAYYKYSDDTNSWGGAVDLSGAGTLKANRCTFDGNYATRGGAISSQDGMCRIWLNACKFGNNYICAGHGTDIYLSVGEMCAINNCCFTEGSYSTLGKGNADWIGVEAAGTLLVANTSMIGSPMKGAASDATTGDNGLVRLGYVAATEYFINNIIVVPTVASNRSVNARSNLHTVYMYGNKRSLSNDGGSSFTYGYGDCDGYLYAASYFGGLQLAVDTASGMKYWKWSGDLYIGSNTDKMLGADVRSLMQEVSADYCTWLTDSCSNAMYKDQLGNTRGEKYWPGAYQE